jgi:hypothetical protein
MLSLELVSQLIYLVALALVVVNYYAIRFGDSYDCVGCSKLAIASSEIWLSIMMFTHLAHELGELMEGVTERAHQSVFLRVLHLILNYFRDEWNLFDLVTNSLVLAWFVLRMVGQFQSCRIVLSVAAIPLSLSLLKYFSLYKPLGELVIMVRAMMVEVVLFIILFVVSIIGFGISFFGLFYGEQGYQSSGLTFLSLFGFKSENRSGETVGSLIVLFVLVMISAILLILPIVVRMTKCLHRISHQVVVVFYL